MHELSDFIDFCLILLVYNFNKTFFHVDQRYIGTTISAEKKLHDLAVHILGYKLGDSLSGELVPHKVKYDCATEKFIKNDKFSPSELLFCENFRPRFVQP